MTELMVPKLDKTPWPSLGGLVCDFIEDYLVYGPGDLQGQPYVLEDEKRAFIWRIYEVYPEGHAMAGRRRFKRVGLSLAKGQAKTEFAAIIACCELHHEGPVRCSGFDQDGNPKGRAVVSPYIPLVAYTETQSDELAYGTMKAILEQSVLAGDFDIGLERIERRRGNGRAVSLAGAPGARDGARTTFQVADETHLWTLRRLKQAHQTMLNNLPKRMESDPWALEVTTAPEPGAGSVAEGLMEYARAVDEGRVTEPTLFFFHRQASDDHDLTTESGARAAVLEASGPTASWRDIEAIMALWRDPTTDLIFWERVQCNRLVKGSAKAFDPIQWGELANPGYRIPDGSLVTLGFDGALFYDSTGLVATEVETGFQQVLGAWEQPYGSAGENWKVPETEVDDLVAAAFQRFDVWRLYADPFLWQSWVAKWAGEYGSDRVIEWFTNRRKQMTAALEGFQTAIKTGLLTHDGDEMMARHIANAYRHDLPQRDDDGQTMFLIRKERSDSPNKIDLAMCGVLSWEARNDAVSEGAQGSDVPSIYETQELRMI